MYKVFLADDEYFVCELLKRVICWDELDLTLVGEAENGIDTLDLIKETNPDIVITDICMPGMDGLDVVKEIKNWDNEIHFILISGHKEFDYAVNAIKYGVEDYLLKPIDENELNKALKRICKTISENKIENEKENNLLSIISKNSLKLKSSFFRNLIADNITIENIEKINSEYNLSFSDGCFLVLIIKLDRIRINNLSLDNCNNILNKIANNIECFLSERELYCINSVCKNRLYCIINSKNNIGKEIIEEIYNIAIKDLDIFIQYNLTISVGQAIVDIVKLYKAFETSRQTLMERLNIGKNRILFYDELELKTHDINTVIKELNVNEIENNLDLLDDRWLGEKLEFIFNELENERYPMYIKIDLLNYIMVSLKSKLNCREDSFSMGDDVADIYNLPDYFFVKKYMKKYILQLYSHYVTERKGLLKKPVRIAKKYIEENYNKDVSLDEISNLVYLNPNYFSVMFKKEEGVNFKEYLMSIRIEKAKELLRKTNYTVVNISSLVGYKDYKYFNSLFKKKVKITPKEYRSLNA